MYHVGLDIGSISVKLVVMSEGGNIVTQRYLRHKGRPFEVAGEVLAEAAKTFKMDIVAATGTGAKTFAKTMGLPYINEVVAIAKGFKYLYPHVRSAIEIGGEDSKLLIFERFENSALKLKDFSMNALCAAGTGSFLEQQALRLRYTIEEFSEIAQRASNIPRIAGRCTVFAKSDMIHLQQIATPDYEIIAGLCYALARNFKSNIAKGKDVKPPVAFIGGVAANGGMKRALQDIFGLSGEEFFVPSYFASIGAAGAIYAVLDEPSLKGPFSGLEAMEWRPVETPVDAHEPLKLFGGHLHVLYSLKETKQKTKGYLGVDVGSISTNLVVIDEQKNIIAKRYLMTEGRPLEAVKRGLAEIGSEVGDRVEIMGVGTTGSGRYLTADFIGADIVRNEITAQAEAAVNIDGDVDTIFEIGGQDSKYISIDRGVIVDFEMNKACAAGTGSFLEEQAERLGISIKDQFGNLALSSKNPIKLGDRCTVFIESDITHHQQKGAKTEDLVGGLSYSIVYNYLNKVVGDRKIGGNIFFQGGTAFNKGVVAAFESVLNKTIMVPPHHEVTGAIGVAILAMKEAKGGRSRFKGFDLGKNPYKVDSFECKGCENLCEIKKVTVENETPLFYGGRCEKYEHRRKPEGKKTIDLFKLREEIQQGVYEKKVDGEVIGVPRVLYMGEYITFWKAFFSELGFSVVFSHGTNKQIIKEGVENVVFETCFPVKIAHGHILDLISRGVKKIFIPSVIGIDTSVRTTAGAVSCPYAQSFPYTVRSSIDFSALGVAVCSPVVYFGSDKRAEMLKSLIKLGRELHRSKSAVEKAFHGAMEAQRTFFRRCIQEGSRVLSSVGEDEKVIVVIGRPYNSLDAGANLNIHRKLRDLGTIPVPLDMLPWCEEEAEGDDDLEGMYWGCGQKILRAARIMRNRKNYYGVYVTNFGCGPDSFITHYFKKAMQGRPFIQLEIDEHSADAGILTRLEAFLDSINNGREEPADSKKAPGNVGSHIRGRKVYIPYMCDHAFGIAGAFKACGIDAEVMEESDARTVSLGRTFTSGKECYPCILTTGDMLKTVKKEGFDPERSAFFMPSGNGPCRFGQYNKLHRLILDEVGYENVPIYAPNQDHRFYEELNDVGRKFARLGWRAVVSIDLITKMLHETRPYETVRGETDKVYKEALSNISQTIERGGNIVEVLKKAVEKFLSIKRVDTVKPVVGIVGEIYIRSNRFSNNDLIRKIEELGGEVSLAPVSEWISYVNLINRKDKPLSMMMKYLLSDFFQRRDEHRMGNLFKKHLRRGEEPKTAHVVARATPYLHPSFQGEAVLSIGKSLDFVEKGVAGIVNVMPFTCMPGTIAGAVMKLIQQDHRIPMMTIAYDGQETLSMVTRLEAFMYQVKEHWQSKVKAP